ncbi:hypothetical protein GCM10010965_11730 [Caldalkalibacillus thermarum]|uniref:hypothetical protein n=1 Tax=Caldalkalibacillus thermarum TaxID=296745 RepID=UPI001667EC49|nr:hypothetical protein [Caldalkalibacillus thermarum]GGK20363.1 hypothetical protein GCM10010965_11730 [Caldalkalibacillus thermarum]
MAYQFQLDQRLGIYIPVLDRDWEAYSVAEQAQILKQWEQYRSDIPGRIKELERLIEQKQEALNNESDFERSCQLNDEIAELASMINDLNIWFRIQEETQIEKTHQ